MSNIERYRYISLDINKDKINNNLKTYLEYLIIIGLFYTIPSTQFIFFQANNNVTCYYNFKCKYDYGIIPSLNNVISNIFYIIFGIIYLLTVKFTKIEDIEDVYKFNKSLYYCLGVCLIFEGIESSFYHICPSKLNLQFDTTFMFIGIIMSYLCLYNNRHIGYICNAFKFYFILSLVIILNVLSLIKKTHMGNWILWVFTFAIMVYCLLFTSIYIYLGKSYDLDLDSIKEAYNNITFKTLYTNSKLWFILISNLTTISLLLYASITNAYFIGWLLFISIMNLTFYFIYYLIYKSINKEKISNSIKLLIFLDIITFSSSLYFYSNTEYNTFLTLEESNKLNDKCVLFNFFDKHDVWHFLSAFGLYIFINIILFLDKDVIINQESINF